MPEEDDKQGPPLKLTRKTQITLLWKLEIVYAALFSMMVLAMSWINATTAVHWDQLDGSQKLNVFINCFVIWSTSMLPVLARWISKIKRGDLPGGEDELEKLPNNTKG